MLLEKSGEIASQGMMRLSQSGNKSPAVDLSGGERKVQCCKEQYFIGILYVQSMNQGKLEVVKPEMTKVSINVLRISEIE